MLARDAFRYACLLPSRADQPAPEGSAPDPAGNAWGLLLQPSPYIVADRYPQFFAHVAGRLAHNPAPRILSFGCSTEDEVFTLRRYFPRAELVGIDINPRAIAKCERRLPQQGGDAGIRFSRAGSTLSGGALRKAALAQLVEHIIRNDGVVGSSPSSGTSPFTRHSRNIHAEARPIGSADWVRFGTYDPKSEHPKRAVDVATDRVSLRLAVHARRLNGNGISRLTVRPVGGEHTHWEPGHVQADLFLQEAPGQVHG